MSPEKRADVLSERLSANKSARVAAKVLLSGTGATEGELVTAISMLNKTGDGQVFGYFWEGAKLFVLDWRH